MTYRDHRNAGRSPLIAALRTVPAFFYCAAGYLAAVALIGEMIK